MNFDNELTYRNKRNGAVVYGGVPPESPDEWEHVYVIPANDAILAVRPAPAWDEDTVTEAVAAALADHAPDLDETAVFLGTCDCGWRVTVPAPFPSEEEHTAHVATAVLAVVREHQHVKPDRDALAAAIRLRHREMGSGVETVTVDDYESADAVLDLWPGRSEAEVKAEVRAEALREAYTQTQERWLRDRAARLAAEGGAS